MCRVAAVPSIDENEYRSDAALAVCPPGNAKRRLHDTRCPANQWWGVTPDDRVSRCEGFCEIAVGPRIHTQLADDTIRSTAREVRRAPDPCNASRIASACKHILT